MKKIVLFLIFLGLAVYPARAEHSFVKRLAPGVKVVQVLPGYSPQWKGSTGLLIGPHQLSSLQTGQTYWRLDPSWQFHAVTDVIPEDSVVSSVTEKGTRAVLTRPGSPATVTLFRFEAGIDEEILRIEKGRYECQWGYQEKEIVCAKLTPEPGTGEQLVNFTVLLQSGKAFSLVYDNLLQERFPLASGDAFAWDRRTDSEQLVFTYWKADEENSYLWCMDLKRKKDQISQNIRLLVKTPSRMDAPVIKPGGGECLILEGVREGGKLVTQHLITVDLTKEKSFKLLTPEGSIVLAADWSGKKGDIVCLGRYGRDKTGLWKRGSDGKITWIYEGDVFLNEDQRQAAKVAVSDDPDVLAFSLKGLGTAVLKLKE